MILSTIISYSHQTIPHYPQVSSSATLHCAHIGQLLSLPFPHHLLAPLSAPGSVGVWDHLESGLRSVMHYSTGYCSQVGHLQHSLPSPKACTHPSQLVLDRVYLVVGSLPTLPKGTYQHWTFALKHEMYI